MKRKTPSPMPNLPFNLPRFAAASALFLAAAASGAVSSFAQETPPPAAPPAPVIPAAPAEPDTKTQTEAEKKQMTEAMKALGEARKAYSDADRKRIEEMVKALQNNNMRVRGLSAPAYYMNAARLPSKTISLDLKNVAARDAVVKVLEEAKLDYVINDDFPQDAKLSLSVSGVQVSTALDLITQSAGVRWAAEKRDNKIIVRVGRKVTGSNLYYRGNGSGTSFELNGLEFNTDGDSPSIFVTPNLPTMPALPAAPIIYQYRTSEQRSTFTCPRCGKKTTVVQKSTVGGAAAKTGTKTTGHEDWHYCPYCGKKVSDQSANLAIPLWDDNDDAGVGAGNEEMPLILPELPVFDTSFTGSPDPFAGH